MDAILHWLTDPTVFRVNRLDAHSDHICFANSEELAREKTSLCQSLDGQWRFVGSKNPRQRPTDFRRTDFDDSGARTYGAAEGVG